MAKLTPEAPRIGEAEKRAMKAGRRAVSARIRAAGLPEDGRAREAADLATTAAAEFWRTVRELRSRA